VANDRAARRPLGDPSRDRATADADRALLDAVRRALHAAADPARAPGMQAYMKSAMPYHGVPAPAQRRTFRQVFADHPLGSAAAWRATVLALWREAGHREERYAAVALASDRRYRAERTSLDALPLFEELIVTGAWWDLVDGVATHLVAGLLAAHRAPMTATLLAWSRSPDRWLRRSAIICQVHAKAATDLELLYACIEPNLADRDFFIRKAIGWALRAYAWTDPDEVARYVRANERRLSGLSRREALKNLGRGPAGSLAP
jgi:3-methyladenine DNA glycosylase AlkD